ncbi:MAG: hypothetical protein ACE37F_33970 [Nannocystaceae bacterium]|nr:hypothetical protein [bacterium]
MSSPDAKPNPDPAERERIAAELAALGEDPLTDDPSDDEALAFALADAPDIDVSTVQTLARWAQPEWDDADAELSELAQARVWRTVELRTKQAEAPAPTPAKRPLLLGAVVALFAAAAAVVLVPVLSPSDASQDEPASVAQAPADVAAVTAEELDVLSMQARASLAALDRLSGQPRGSARAEAMADAYARRLEAEG